jgi:hypothetical protein
MLRGTDPFLLLLRLQTRPGGQSFETLKRNFSPLLDFLRLRKVLQGMSMQMCQSRYNASHLPEIRCFPPHFPSCVSPDLRALMVYLMQVDPHCVEYCWVFSVFSGVIQNKGCKARLDRHLLQRNKDIVKSPSYIPRDIRFQQQL